VRAELADLAASLDDVPELDALLENPEIDSRVKADVLERLLGEADELVRNFARLVAEKGRAGELREIVREFEALAAEAEGVIDVELTTAHELSDEEFGRIVGRIEEASGKRVRPSRTVDPSLIGGIVLQVGSHRLDASLRGRLERLRTELAGAR
jgi:F-type H+-transporting ATPase subunit delta